MTMVDILLLAIGAYAVLLLYTLSRPRSPATLYFALVLLISLVWDLSYYLELVLPALNSKVMAHLFRFFFLPWLTLCWIAMIGHIFPEGRLLSRWFWVVAIALNVATMLMVVSNPYHTLFQYDFAIQPVGVYGILTYSEGHGHRLYLFFANVLAWLALVLMILAWSRVTPSKRKTLAVLILGYVIPLVMNLLWVLRKSPITHVNLAPFTTIISISALAWVVLGYRALDVIPVARSLLIDSLRDLVFVLDRQGWLVDMNTAARRALNLAPEGCLGRAAKELPEPWGPRFEACANHPHSAPELCEFELNGKHRWFEGSCMEIAGDAGKALGKLVVLRDVTEQTMAEQSLRDSEEELRLIVDNMSEAVFIHEADGLIVAVNQTMLRLYGLSSMAEAARFDIEKDYLAPEPGGVNLKSYWTRVMEGEEVVIPHLKARRPLTGVVFDVSVVLHLMHRGGRKLVLASVTDITAELAHQQQELAYQKMMADRQHVRQQELLIRDLHDGIGGLVAGIGMISALGLKETAPAPREAALRKIMDLAAEANVEIRSLMNTLESRELLWPDLIVEMRRHGTLFQDNHGIRLSFSAEGEGDAGGPGLFAGMSLFRIFKEALSNVAKHAGADSVAATLSLADGRFRLVIADNGHGLVESRAKGRGIRNMRQRIEELGGGFTMVSEKGLRLVFEAPLPLKSPDQGMDGEPMGQGIV